MSLIEEALRRVQNQAKGAPTPAPARPEAPQKLSAVQIPPAPPASDAPTAHSWTVAAPATREERADAAPLPPFRPAAAPSNVLTASAVAVLILTSALVLGAAYWLGQVASSRKHPAPAQVPNEVSRPVPPAAAAPEPQPAPAPAPAPLVLPLIKAPKAVRVPLSLSGVAIGRGASYVVINGAILTIGERIEGATLTDIKENVAVLEYPDGDILTLRVPR